MIDVFLWTHVPGNSSGSCNGGPASGAFWPARAISLAESANGRIGPGFPSQPYRPRVAPTARVVRRHYPFET